MELMSVKEDAGESSISPLSEDTVRSHCLLPTRRAVTRTLPYWHGSQTSSFQNHEEIHFCWFQLPVVCSILFWQSELMEMDFRTLRKDTS